MSEMGIRERVTNILLLLYLIERSSTKGKVEDELKLQKLVFLSQKELVERRLKAFSYNFFRWKKGPFSKHLRMDLNILIESHFLSSRYGKIELTQRGKDLLNDCENLLTENKQFLRFIDNVVSNFSGKSPEEIKDFVYDLQVIVPRIRQIMTIRDVPPRQLILFKTSDRKARAIFNLDPSWLATLELSFDKDAMTSLERAVDDALEGRVHEYTIRDNST